VPKNSSPLAKGNSRIGVERESSLHRALKFRWAGTADRTETPRAGYVCDGVSETGELLEVQTGSFAPLKIKVQELAVYDTVRIIHPIILTKHIEVYDEGGVLQSSRKSPRKGTIWDLFKALLYAPELPSLPNVIIELALVEIRERRIQDGRGSWRRKGQSIADRELTACRGTLPLESLRDYRCFVPFKDGEEFTVRILGSRVRIPETIARKTLYVLTKLNVVERRGKEGNAWIYGIKENLARG
jgi:hypothetical protein